jgi:uncharacterized protein (UPF0332 family)
LAANPHRFRKPRHVTARVRESASVCSRDSGSIYGQAIGTTLSGFHAAQSVLHTRGFDPTTHGGVLTLFGREIVSEGDATGEDGRFLDELQSYRPTADCEHNRIEANIDELFAQAEEFVRDMEALL